MDTKDPEDDPLEDELTDSFGTGSADGAGAGATRSLNYGIVLRIAVQSALPPRRAASLYILLELLINTWVYVRSLRTTSFTT
jgi:hypothetical protein